MTNVFHSQLIDRQPFATELFSSAVRQGKLAHAYLLVGRAEKEKWDIAREMACFLNCANVKEGCQNNCLLTIGSRQYEQIDISKFCQNCRWIWEGKHPQAWLTLVSDTTKSGKIPVEKARQLSDELAKESQFTRIVVIENAAQDKFHRPAANALLKTIEDPKVNCVFLLFARSADEVLATVVSRCQVVPLQTTEIIGASIFKRDLSGYPQETIDLARECIDHHIRRKDSQALARLLDFSRRFQELVTDEFVGADAIDLLVTLELQHIGERAIANPRISNYLKKLLDLSQSSKEQLDHYVSPKVAMESFALSWWRLASGTPFAH
ncbi:MAG TPA: hypothetical protein V6C81_26515 [Planktothrix sp.]|jgi:hypothetical protein